jgi:protein TonB
MKAFYHYIQENLKYPEEAKKQGIEGKVFVQFVVDKDGKLTEVKAVKGIGAGCDEEAVRVIKEAPAWNPATVVDMPVKIRMILPITYKLDKKH